MKEYLQKPRPGEMTTFNSYASLSRETWQGESALLRAVLGISGEAGEVSECLKKHLRGDYDWTECEKRLAKELGDVLYYIARIADEIGFSLQEIAEMNIFKLYTRYNNNSIKGDGDDR